MRINYNATAVIANNSLNKNDNKLASSIERLSSGLKINHAKDNPAGIAISNRMDAQIKGVGVASDNTNDGISVVETADGALSEITAILQRMNQLANQAGDGVKTDDDRALINDEIIQLKQEIERIAKDTEFNGMPLLDGSFELKGYTNNEAVEVDYYSDDVKVGLYTINLDSLFNADGDLDPSALSPNFPTQGLAGITVTDPDTGVQTITITAANDFEMKLKAQAGASGEVELDITGIGAMKIQIGANEDQELAVRIPRISLEDMGLEKLDVRTIDGAQSGLDMIKEALSYVSAARSRLGAYQNRMEHNAANLAVTEENMTASYSRIMDVDMAEEMTEYTSSQVLTQAGTSMLAQANERPQMILQLLQ